MLTCKSILSYFIPRRIRLKNTVLCIILFIILIIIIDDKMNNHDQYEKEVDAPADKKIDLDNAAYDDGYRRELFHPRFGHVLERNKIQTTTTTTTTTTTLTTTTTTTTSTTSSTSSNAPTAQAVYNVNINYEFDLPKLNTSRLLMDDNYRNHIKHLFFNTQNENSFILINNKSDDLIVKECKCERISCFCCINVTVNDVDFEHYSCVNITYDKGYEKFIVNITNNNQFVYDTKLPLRDTPDLCLNSKYTEYCLVFSETYFNKNTIAGCLRIRVKLLTLKTILINKQAGCYKLPSNTKLDWKEILFSNKTYLNMENMNKNLANWIL